MVTENAVPSDYMINVYNLQSSFIDLETYKNKRTVCTIKLFHPNKINLVFIPYIYHNNTVQITFIFMCQTRLVFGKCVCTCVTKHSNAFRTFLNWLKNSKRVWHERNCTFRVCLLFANFDLSLVAEWGFTVQITFIFIGQTRLVFGKCVCTCVTKHSNAFRTLLNWLRN